MQRSAVGRVFRAVGVRGELPKDVEVSVSAGAPISAASARLPFGWVDPHKCTLLLLPILVALANSTWLFTSAERIDPWVYFGYFQHLTEYKSTLFPNLYYGSRLPWLLPGYIAYHLFQPIVANYVLHFAFYYAATFSLYSLLKHATNAGNALLATVLFGTYAPFLESIGWDYVDGAGITYFLLALAAAGCASRAHSRLWLLTSGMAALAMCYTNLFLMTFVPFVLAFYLFLKIKGMNRTSFGALADLVVWFSLGAILITVILGEINVRLDGHFWFYQPSISYYLATHAAPNPWTTRGWKWILDAYWLGIPAATTLACLVYVFREVMRRGLKFGDARTYFVLQFLAIAGGMVAWQAIGATGLSITFYASYMIPGMFLAIGCLLGDARDQAATHAKWAVIVASTTLFCVISYEATGAWATALNRSTNLRVAAACAAAGLVFNVLFRRSWYTAAIAVTLLGLYQFGFDSLVGRSHYKEVRWRHVVEGARSVWPYEQKHAVSFWYNANESHGMEFNGVNAVYLWGYSYVGTGFPKIEVPARLVPGATIVMPITSSHSMERANEVLHANHLQAKEVSTYTVGSDDASFQIGFLALESYPPH
jgi:hypothetical protein